MLENPSLVEDFPMNASMKWDFSIVRFDLWSKYLEDHTTDLKWLVMYSNVGYSPFVMHEMGTYNHQGH